MADTGATGVGTHRGNGEAGATIPVVAAVVTRGETVLAAHRTDGLEGPGWEFPGGKPKEGETAEQAVRREFAEEMGARLQVVWDYDGFSHEVPGVGRLSMEVFVATLEPGEEPAATAEHDRLAWLGRDDLLSVDWLPIDGEVARELGHYWDDIFIEEHL